MKYLCDNNKEILKMAFKPGESGNPSGRPIGIKNKSKKPISLRLEGLLERSFDRIESEIETASPEVRRSFFVDLASVVLRTKNQTS